MRLRILARPTRREVEGIPLDHFIVGRIYDVSTTLGNYLLSEGWAKPVETEATAISSDDHQPTGGG
jgi:hypothetical protein